MEKNITPDLVRRYFSCDCSTAEEIFVESWLIASPDITKQAMQRLEEFPEEEEQLVAQVLDSQQEVWEKTADKLLYSKKKEEVNRFLLKSNKKIIRASNTQKHWLAAMSVLSGLILISFAMTYYWKNQEISVQAGFGQIQQVTLPDNSLVYLNGNSKLIYNRNWQGKERKVWLGGEAFFNVVHIKDHQKFTVHLLIRPSTRNRI